MDSTVLLHALAAIRAELPVSPTAVHVDHGLQAEAMAWGDHCEAECARLGIALTRLAVDARPRRGESPEAAAREARYTAIAGVLQEGEWLLTAHHRDDQGETLLLQLLRGSGPRGLAAMPTRLPLGRGGLLRPLLSFNRAELADWATSQRLAWVEDPSNCEIAADRNFLRQRVLPLLQARWPALERTLSRAAAHQQDASELLDALAATDLDQAGSGDGQLRADALLVLSPARCRNLLRFWLRTQRLRPPSAVVLQRVLDEMLAAAADRNPLVHWHGGEIRRYRGLLYAMQPRAAQPPQPDCDWDLQQPLAFAGGWLCASLEMGRGLRADACAGGVTIGSRVGGERCRPAGQGHSRSLKALLQQAGVPPWQRQRVALVRVDGELLQAVGLCVAAGWEAGAGECGVLIEWVTGVDGVG
jgi:tRNA(Ile)-lysidine synthase